MLTFEIVIVSFEAIPVTNEPKLTSRCLQLFSNFSNLSTLTNLGKGGGVGCSLAANHHRLFGILSVSAYMSIFILILFSCDFLSPPSLRQIHKIASTEA